MSDLVKARPHLVDDGREIATFYALHADLSGRRQAASLCLMMRSKGIATEWSRRVGHPPGLIRCLSCKLGAVTPGGLMVRVTCKHGDWLTGPDARLTAMIKLGANLAPCSLCGKVFAPKGVWEWFGGAPDPFEKLHLRFCCERCRDRAQRLPYLSQERSYG